MSQEMDAKWTEKNIFIVLFSQCICKSKYIKMSSYTLVMSSLLLLVVVIVVLHQVYLQNLSKVLILLSTTKQVIFQ